MDKKKAPSDSSSKSIPPPADPFTRFQQPWPRSDQDEENPFIQFRRFADESFNSFFAGVPKLFGLPSSSRRSWEDDFQKQIEDHIKKRMEIEEGIRKQIEQNFEEMRQAFNKRDDDKKKVQIEDSPSQPWWQRGNAANCPALQELSGDAKKCPALFDEQGQARTELDAYEQQDSNQVGQTQASKEAQNPIDLKPFSWSSGLGWDGKVKKSYEEAVDRSWTPASPSKQDEKSGREVKGMESLWMDPFTTPRDTISWLMLNPYSPVYLCNPEQDFAVRAEVKDGINEAFSIKTTQYQDRSQTNGDIDRKTARALPWADAFEDLISIQNTGKMIERNASTFRTPNTWIHEMVARGSLGPCWGFNDGGQLAQKREWPQPGPSLRNIWRNCQPQPLRSVEMDGDDVVDAVLRRSADVANDAEECNEAASSNDAQAIEHETQDAKKESFEKDDQEFIDPIVREFDAALNVFEELLEEADKDQLTSDEYLPGAVVDRRAEPEAAEESTTTSEVLSRHNAINTKDIRPSNSIVSSMTRTETETLQDGSRRTYRVLKQRFADGREQKEETVDIVPPPLKMTSAEAPINVDRQTQTFTPARDTTPEESTKKGGWFWN